MQQQPVGHLPSATPAPVDPLVTLADATAALRNLQHLSLAPPAVAAPALPARSPLPARVEDDRLVFGGTRRRRSAHGDLWPDRIASEVYPLAAPPRIDFLPGSNSRMAGRDPIVVHA